MSACTGPVGDFDALSWAQQRRLELIDWRLRWEGQINRSDLTDFFGISVPQASLDLRFYKQAAPDAIRYDPSERTYRPTPAFQSRFSRTSSPRYLHALLLAHDGAAPAGGFGFSAWLPVVASSRLPAPQLGAGLLVVLLRALRSGGSVSGTYQTDQAAAPCGLLIAPHALFFDGRLWWVRAFDEGARAFDSFCLARLADCHADEARRPEPWPDQDLLWHTQVEVVFAPDDALSVGERRAVQLDYGMSSGTLRLACRAALLPFVFQAFGLQADGRGRANSDLVVSNLSDLLDTVRRVPGDAKRQQGLAE